MSSVKQSSKPKRITICPSCGHRMRVKLKHIGRACRCTQCKEPVFVTQEDVIPPIKLFERNGTRYFQQEEVPLHWQKGDRFFGRYEVFDFLGAGGMGVVHRVHHKSWDVDLAVKTPNSKLLKRPDMLRQFEKEAEVWVGLPLHPNIVYCYYVAQLGSVPRIFMEYVPGHSLSACIRERRLYEGGGEEALRKILAIALQIAHALQTAHNQELVHQDVKPLNILITPDWSAKVTDFGLVRALTALASSDAGSDAISVPGTPPYSSPEQVALGPITVKADMWGWAASVIEMLVGGISWRDYRELLNALDTFLSNGRGDGGLPVVPDSLGQLLRDCFREDPADRPASMEEISNRLHLIHAELFAESCSIQQLPGGDDTAASLNNRAVSLADLGKNRMAEEVWHEVLQKHSAHFESRYNFGLHLWHEGRIGDIGLLNLLREACERDPEDWHAKYLLGCVMIERGDYAAAKAVLDAIPEPDYSRREVFIAAAVARSDGKRGHECIATISAHAAPITNVCVSHDGKYAVSADSSGVFKYWHIDDGAMCEASFASHPAGAMCASPDNDRLLIAKLNGEVEIRDLPSNRSIQSFRAHDGAVLAVTYDPDQTRMATGGEDGLIRIWDLPDFTPLGSLEGHIRAVNALDWSRCGRFVLSGSTDACVRLWDCGLQESLMTMRGHKRRVFGVAFGKDEKTGYSCGRDGLVNVWNLEEGSLRRRYQGHSSEAFSLSASSESDYLLTGSRNGAIKLWDTSKGYCIRSFVGSAPCQISRNGSTAVSAGPDGTLRFWRISTTRCRYPATPVFCKE